MSEEEREWHVHEAIDGTCSNIIWEYQCRNYSHSISWEEQEYGIMCAGDTTCRDSYEKRVIRDEWP